MRLAKKASTIGLAVATLLMAILSLSPFGSASKCDPDCTGSPSIATAYALTSPTNQGYNILDNSSVYAASALSNPESLEPRTIPDKTRTAKVKPTTSDKEVLRRTLVAILLLCATESHRTTVAN